MLPVRVGAFFRKALPAIGARPGTLAPPEGAPPPEVFVYEYGPAGVEERRLDDPGDPRALAALAAPRRPTWIDVRGLGDRAVLQRIGDAFGLHPLALEDAVNAPQRAKSELYEAHHLVIARLPVTAADGSLELPQVALFFGRGWLLTFQERFFGFFEPVRARLREGVGPIRERGVDYLGYALLDALVDRYYPLAMELSDQLDSFEEDVLEGGGSDLLEEIYRNRRTVLMLRRVAKPQREALSHLVEQESPFVGDEVRLYLRDTWDHIAQVTELLDACHEMSRGLVEVVLSELSHRTNEVMKVLTLMASIFIPLTFLAGIYGMNFEYMPELQERWGYPLLLAVMVAVAVAMVAWFRWRGWLGARRRRRRRARAREEARS